MTAHGCYALTATTGLTAQNTLGVQDIFVVPAEFVKKQINAGLEDVGADVVKLGKCHLLIPVFVVWFFWERLLANWGVRNAFVYGDYPCHSACIGVS